MLTLTILTSPTRPCSPSLSPSPSPSRSASPSPGELAQLGDSVLDGLEAATGQGHITVRSLPNQYTLYML